MKEFSCVFGSSGILSDRHLSYRSKFLKTHIFASEQQGFHSRHFGMGDTFFATSYSINNYYFIYTYYLYYLFFASIIEKSVLKCLLSPKKRLSNDNNVTESPYYNVSSTNFKYLVFSKKGVRIVRAPKWATPNRAVR